MYEIQEAAIEDAAEILNLQRVAYQSEAALHDDYEIPPLTQSLEELQAEFGKKFILKVVINGKIVGSGQAKLDNGVCYIGRIAVEPTLRGRGIGSLILKTLEDRFEEARRYELFTGENSFQNLIMYERRGYRQYKSEKLGKTRVIFLEKVLVPDP